MKGNSDLLPSTLADTLSSTEDFKRLDYLFYECYRQLVRINSLREVLPYLLQRLLVDIPGQHPILLNDILDQSLIVQVQVFTVDVHHASQIQQVCLLLTCNNGGDAGFQDLWGERGGEVVGF